MLVEAYLHKERLEQEIVKISNDPFFDTLTTSHAIYKYEIVDNTWNKHQFVSIKDYDILGYLEADVNRTVRYISNLIIINFKKEFNPVFYMDLKQFIILLFIRYNYNKIVFSVHTKSKNEKMYDKFVNLYGGKIVGTFYKSIMLQDGTIVDEKYYEIFRDDFIRNLKNKHPKLLNINI